MKWWENICEGCGRCCHDKVRVGRRSYILDLDHKCRYLNDEDRCSIYNSRFAINRECKKMTLFRAMFASWIPSSCAYVRWARSHHIRFCSHVEWICSHSLRLDGEDS